MYQQFSFYATPQTPFDKHPFLWYNKDSKLTWKGEKNDW